MAGDNAINLNTSGLSLIELLVVLSIIGILMGIGVVYLSDVGLSSFAKAKAPPEDLRAFLNYARIKAVGSNSNVVVAFNPTDKFYYACLTNSNDCTAGEQAGVGLSMPDAGINFSGVALNGVSLKYNVAFGTHAEETDEYVAKKILSGEIKITTEDVYYQEASSTTSINTSTGMHLIDTNPSRVVFRRNGTADGGSAYLYLRVDDKTSYHYAVEVSSMGKVDLYQWAKVGTAYKWKLISASIR